MMLIDSHCHLNFEAFNDDMAQVLERAREAGVAAFINPATNLSDSHQIITMSDQIPYLFATVGIHPNDSGNVDDDQLTQLRNMAARPEVVAIGEIGLDYYWDTAPRSDQQQVFQHQLAMAKEVNKPVIIHQRDSAADTMTILRQWGAGGNHPGLVLHSFSGDMEMALEGLELGFYIGISGPVTFKNARGLPEIVATIPLDRLLVETDAPFLSPHPFRGKRNEPARVKIIAEKIAVIHNRPFETVCEYLTANTKELFNLPDITLK
jgi:TatD DNase family protein